MKTNDPTVRKRMKWIGMILLAVVAALGFSYLYTRGVSPVCTAALLTIAKTRHPSTNERLNHLWHVQHHGTLLSKEKEQIADTHSSLMTLENYAEGKRQSRKVTYSRCHSWNIREITKLQK